MPASDTGLSEKILQTAKSLFVQKGYHGMSMREVSEALGVSKAALYYYYQDKEQLFLAILDSDLEASSAALNDIIARPVSSRERIQLFVEYILQQPPVNRAAIRLASQEIGQLGEEARSRFGAVYQANFIDKIAGILQKGMDDGEFRWMPAGVAARALLGIVFPYLDSMHAGAAAVPPETIQEVVEIYLNGVSAK